MFCVNAIAVTKDRDAKLNQLFEVLQKNNNVSTAFYIEMEI